MTESPPHLTSSQIFGAVSESLSAGKTPEAIEMLTSYVSQCPEDAVGHLMLAKLAYATERRDAASSTLKKILHRFESTPCELSEAAKIHVEAQNTGEANFFYEKVLAKDPRNKEARAWCAEWALTHKDFNSARNHLECYVAFHPDHARFWCLISQLRLRAGETQGGIDALIRARKIDYTAPEFKIASELALKDAPENPEVLLSMAYVLMNEKRYEEAVLSAERALELSPSLKEAPLLAVGILYVLGRISEVRETLVKAHKAHERRLEELGLQAINVRVVSGLFCVGFGHISILDSFVKMEKLGFLETKKNIIFRHKLTSNHHYLNYWDKYVHILTPEEEPYYSGLHEVLEEPGHVWKLTDGTYADIYELYARGIERWEDAGGEPLLELTPDDCAKGYEFLKKHGVPEHAPFVTLHVRDSGFDEHGNPIIAERSARNASIDSYMSAVKELTSRGVWVFRIGDPKMKRIPPLPGLIDLTLSTREPWVDIFLMAKNLFMLASASGPSTIPPTFGKPVLTANWISSILFPPPSKDMFVPKLLWSKEKSRYLSMSECAADHRLHYLENPRVLEELGLTLVDTSEELIREAAIEMYERTTNSIQYSAAEDLIQKKVRECAGPALKGGRARISRGFLKRHPEIIG